MEIQLIRQYVYDAHKAYQACLTSLLGSDEKKMDLSELIRAARKLVFDRRGTVITPESYRYEYHVHGTGYTFTDMANGKNIRFNVESLDYCETIRFGAWEIYRYASSIGEQLTQEEISAELRRLSETEPCLTRIAYDRVEYYLYKDVQ